MFGIFKKAKPRAKPKLNLKLKNLKLKLKKLLSLKPVVNLR